MSLTTNVPTSTATKQGGTLLNLPRELRDMIYRHVLKRTYLVGAQLPPLCRGTRHLNISSNLSILRVSKIISDEAMAVLYAESTFRIYAYLGDDQPNRLSFMPTVERMMNIELDVKVDPTFQCFDSPRRIWIATLSSISRTSNLRNNLNVRWRRIFSELNLDREPEWWNMDLVIPDWMFRELESMTRFRTVTLQNFIQHNVETSDQEPKSFLDKKETTAIKDHLTRALGPADSVLFPGYPQCAASLTFHPQQHMPALLRARAVELRAKADELELEAKRAEEGI